jgi:beta-carotene 3-hydroxylase
MIGNVLIFLATYAAMEGVAWLMHKYLMHGPLWFLHESHHRPRPGRFERNDAFGIFFSLVSMGLFYVGVHGHPAITAVACGVTAYGFTYFAFHDVLVHKRIPHRFRPKSAYLKHIVRAHHIHHKSHEKDGCVSFGFLYAPRL